jgi:hypothetical protein
VERNEKSRNGTVAGAECCVTGTKEQKACVRMQASIFLQ